ncbi:MAG: UDP-N-acetylenolpyruvoylglucosamine reductase [Phycisphaerae bacterium]|nr:UDP-N-acetylenolpyruvoylglucosamine reductase [Phycisphaerae bacterium]
MTIFKEAEFREIVTEREPLARHTWFRLGGPARYFIQPRNEKELASALARCRDNSVPIYVLGGGANLLIPDDGIDGAVVKLAGEFAETAIDEDGTVTAGAGVDMSKLNLRCVREGLAGMECLTGVPGSVGGGVKMNAGGAFGDIGNIIRRVKLMDATGTAFFAEKDDLVFAYRSTNINAKFILQATFDLTPDDPEEILKKVKEIWFFKKNSQPLNAKSAGCVFKNPRQLSAGALIDQAGLKGTEVGGAQVSEKHANFIIARLGAKSADVLKLIELVRQRVFERFGVQLELELEVW